MGIKKGLLAGAMAGLMTVGYSGSSSAFFGKTPEHKKAYKEVLSMIDEKPESFSKPKFTAQIKEMVSLAYDELLDSNNGRMKIDGSNIRVNMELDGQSYIFHTTVKQYLLDVANGIVSSEIDYGEEKKMPWFLNTNRYNHYQAIDSVVSRYYASHGNNGSLADRITVASDFIDMLGNNVEYAKDKKRGMIGRIIGHDGTQYLAPFAKTDSIKERLLEGTENLEYLKSTGQFLIDGNGDCDDYSLAAASFVERAGVRAYIVYMNMPYVDKKGTRVKDGKIETTGHGVMGIQITKQEYNQLANYENYLKAVGSQIWDDNKRLFSGNNIENLYWDNYELPSSIRLKIGSAHMLLLEPQSKADWKGVGDFNFDWDKRFNQHVANHMKVRSVYDVASGEKLEGQVFFSYRGKDSFSRVNIRRNGQIEFCKNEWNGACYKFNYR